MSDTEAAAFQAELIAPEAITPLWVLGGLAMAPLVGLGLARFAYALLLPAMRADLGWSYADAGAMNTANAVGYLVGALLATSVAAKLGDKKTFVAGLVCTAVMLVWSGLTSTFTTLLVLRALAGVAGAVAFIVGAGLAAASASGGGAGRAPLALGVYFGGAGLGIVVSALSVPSLMARYGWRGGWICLGILSFVATALALPALARAHAPAFNRLGTMNKQWSPRTMFWVLSSYALYGAGYIAYATFIVAFLRTDQGFTSREVSFFWALLGTAAVAGAFAWGSLLGRLPARWGIVATITVVVAGTILPLVAGGRVAAYASALLFGCAFLAVVAAVTSFARRAAPPHAWTAAIGVLTAAFALGQCIGPILSGALSDGVNGVRTGLLVAAAILAVSIPLAALQPEPKAAVR